MSLWTNASATLFINNKLLNYAVKNKNKFKHISVHKNESILMSFPKQNCSINNTFCALKIISNDQYQINMTVLNLVYQGTLNIMSRYAGLAAYDKDEKEMTVLSFVHEGYKYRSIYSNTSTIILVLYTYPEYGHLRMNFTLSVTKCRSVSITACDNACMKHGFRHRLVDVNQNSNLSFQCQDDDYLDANVGENQCFILQVNHNYTTPLILNYGFKRHACILKNIGLASQMKPNQIVKYRVTGFLSGNLV